MTAARGIVRRSRPSLLHQHQSLQFAARRVPWPVMVNAMTVGRALSSRFAPLVVTATTVVTVISPGRPPDHLLPPRPHPQRPQCVQTLATLAPMPVTRPVMTAVRVRSFKAALWVKTAKIVASG